MLFQCNPTSRTNLFFLDPLNAFQEETGEKYVESKKERKKEMKNYQLVSQAFVWKRSILLQTIQICYHEYL